ncbi:MAG: InlB B-repeat-containing protein [Phocaeicola sp.]
MFKLIKSTLFVLSVILAMSSCSKENIVEAPTKMSITFAAGDNGTVDPEGVQTGNAGSTIFSVATPNNGSVFDGWFDGEKRLVTEGDITVNGNTLSVTFTEATAGKTYTAKFIVQHIVTFAAGDNGTVGPEGVQTGNAGSTIFSVATPNGGFVFGGWFDGEKKLVTEGDIIVKGDTLNVTFTEATAGRTYTAKFIVQYSVTFAADENGRVNPDVEQKDAEGRIIEAIATANENYRFAGWFDGEKKLVTEGDFIVKGDTLNVKLSAETDGKTYTATFEIDGPSFSFTIETSSTDSNYKLPFGTSGSTGPYTLSVNWGDGTKPQTIPAGTSLDGGINHKYESAGEHTITITSSETDYTKAQMPGVNWKGDMLLISINTPLLNTRATSFNEVFSNCLSLASIPGGLFDNNKEVTTFRFAFFSCASLTSIPEGLFKYNTKATDFGFAFCWCFGAKMNSNIFCDEATEKATRFQSVTEQIIFTATFQSVGFGLSDASGSTFPTLWDYGYSSAGVNSNYCFTDAKATNSDGVKDGWK